MYYEHVSFHFFLCLYIRFCQHTSQQILRVCVSVIPSVLSFPTGYKQALTADALCVRDDDSWHALTRTMPSLACVTEQPREIIPSAFIRKF
jgi:hypothetical protein